MDKLKSYIIKKGEREIGITLYDIERSILTPKEFLKFSEWMKGQTVGCIDDSCQTTIVYTGDLIRFINGLPNID